MLARRLTARPAITVAAAFLASTITYFSFDVVRFGPLLPFGLAIAVVPPVIALADRTLTQPSFGPILALALAVSSLVATHPAIAVAAVPWSLLHVLIRMAFLRRTALRGLGAPAVSAAVARRWAGHLRQHVSRCTGVVRPAVWLACVVVFWLLSGFDA